MLADTCGQVDDAPLRKQLLSIVTYEKNIRNIQQTILMIFQCEYCCLLAAPTTPYVLLLSSSKTVRLFVRGFPGDL